MAKPPVDWPPLGLPRGSVRALLTLLIVSVVIVQMVRGQTVDVLWTETLLIALAHYFTSRRFVNLPPDVSRRLVEEGVMEAEVNPLFLPRYSIRVILFLAFAGLAVYLYRENRLREPQTLSLLGVVAAYLLGVVARFRHFRVWEDFKAVVVLLVLIGTAGMYFAGRGDQVPREVRDVALGLVLFYFGSR